MAHNERHEELVAVLAAGMPLGAADATELETHLAGGCLHRFIRQTSGSAAPFRG